MPKKTVLFCGGFLCGVLVTLFALTWGSGICPLPAHSQTKTNLEQQAAGALPIRISSEEGGSPSQGPENAAIKLVEYGDFHCPFCSRVAPTVDRLMKEYSGKIHRVWKHYPLPFHKGADQTHLASECAHEQGKFWEFHNFAFQHPEKINSPDFINAVPQELGLDGTKFKACMDSQKYADKIQRDIQQGAKDGVQGTPATFINGHLLSGAVPYEMFKAAIEHPDSVPSAVNPPQQPQAPSAPVVVNFDDLKGKPSQGPDKAPITLVEFSDFHCPFCKKIAPTLDQLMQNHPGQIRRVWRHYPLPFHVGAERTHLASECANDQGKFWEYAAKVFENQDKLPNDQILKDLAKELGLKMSKFENCLSSQKYRDRISKDLAKAAEVKVQGTPTVYINGERVVGARPYEQFEQIVQSKLKKS